MDRTQPIRTPRWRTLFALMLMVPLGAVAVAAAGAAGPTGPTLKYTPPEGFSGEPGWMDPQVYVDGMVEGSVEVTGFKPFQGDFRAAFQQTLFADRMSERFRRPQFQGPPRFQVAKIPGAEDAVIASFGASDAATFGACDRWHRGPQQKRIQDPNSLERSPAHLIMTFRPFSVGRSSAWVTRVRDSSTRTRVFKSGWKSSSATVSNQRRRTRATLRRCERSSRSVWRAPNSSASCRRRSTRGDARSCSRRLSKSIAG